MGLKYKILISELFVNLCKKTIKSGSCLYKTGAVGWAADYLLLVSMFNFVTLP